MLNLIFAGIASVHRKPVFRLVVSYGIFCIYPGDFVVYGLAATVRAFAVIVERVVEFRFFVFLFSIIATVALASPQFVTVVNAGNVNRPGFFHVVSESVFQIIVIIGITSRTMANGITLLGAGRSNDYLFRTVVFMS